MGFLLTVVTVSYCENYMTWLAETQALRKGFGSDERADRDTLPTCQ